MQALTFGLHIWIAVCVIAAVYVFALWLHGRMKKFTMFLLLASIVLICIMWLSVLALFWKIISTILIIIKTMQIKEKRSGPIFPDDDFEGYGYDSDEIRWGHGRW